MAYTPKRGGAAVVAEANAVLALLNNGTIKIYTGGQVATVDTAVSGTLLCTLTFGATAFATPNASTGVTISNAITSGSCGNTGTAGWFRCWQSNGTTGVLDGNCGTSGCDMNLSSLSLVSTGVVSIAGGGFTYTPTLA